MTDYTTTPIMNRTRLCSWSAALVLLAAPLVTMQFTREVQWTVSDFAVFAVMISGAGLAFEFLVSRAPSSSYRIAAAITVIGAFLTVWVNLAVGVIGSEDNPANLMYLGLLVIGGIGAAMTRFRPAGMARVLAALAILQVAIMAVALIGHLGIDGLAWPRDVIGATVMFSGVWLTAAWLFHRARATV